MSFEEINKRDLNLHESFITDLKKHCKYPVESIVEMEGERVNHCYALVDYQGIKMRIRNRGYDKKYHISYEDNLKYVEYYDIKRIKENLKKPNDIGVFSTKKLEDWFKYLFIIHKEAKELSERKVKTVDDFLESLKDLNVVWGKDRLNGRVIKNGIEFSFSIDTSNGYISRDLSIHYSCNKDVETFKKLSNNDYKVDKE